MFHVHFRRKYILLLLDGISCKYQLRLSRITYHLIFYLVYLFIDEIGVLKSLTITVLISVSPFIDVSICFVCWHAHILGAYIPSLYLLGLILWLLHACVLTRFSCVQLCVTQWTVGCQTPLSRDSSGKNTGVGSHTLLQDLPDPGFEPASLLSAALAGRFLNTSATCSLLVFC